MAIIYSVSSSYFGTASWNDPSIWQGGIVPTASDTVYIFGLRAVLRQTDDGNVGSSGQGIANGLGYWSGLRDISTFQEYFTGSGFVPANTPIFPKSGSLYTYTNRNALVKIDYKDYHFSGSGFGSVFRDCSVDTSFFPWASASWPNDEPQPSIYGGFIPNNAWLLYYPGVIAISGSSNVDFGDVEVNLGGKLHIYDSASINLKRNVKVREGEFKISGSVTVKWDNPWTGSWGVTATTSSQMCFISQSYVGISTIEFVGPEVRTNTKLLSSSLVGDSFLTVQNPSGFAPEDWIFVGEDELTINRSDNGMRGNYPYARNASSVDETFGVVSVSGSRIYVKRQNAVESKILATSSSTTWIVDDERWQVGDKVVINNQTATITNVEDFDLLLNDYDFTTPTASLDNWETDVSRADAFQGWVLVKGVGLTQYQQNSQTLYRHTIEKTVMRDRVKFEAWISNIPLNATGSVTSSYSFNNVDTSDSSYFGIFINSDPGQDNYATGWIGGGGNTRAISRTYLSVFPKRGLYWLAPRFEFTQGANTSGSLELATGLQRPYNGLYKLGLEYYKGVVKGYINDKLVAENFAPNQTSWGRNGIYSLNNRLIVTRYRTYAKTQKITLNVGISASVGDTFYETGMEYPHAVNNQVIKLASVVTNPLDHDNLAFAYKGAPDYDNTGIYPFVYQINFTGSERAGQGNSWMILTNNQYYDQYLDISAGNDNRNITIDLVTPVTVSNAAFNEYWANTYQNYTSSAFPVAISGSLDAVTWVPLTGGADLRPRIHSEGLRDFDFTPAPYRYIRFRFAGINNAPTSQGGQGSNWIRSLYVRNFADGLSSPRLQLNNASDLNVGDQIVIVPINQNQRIQNSLREIYPFINANSSSAFLLDFYPDHYTITGKSGSIITLDKKINKFPVTKNSLVFKINRGLQFSGSYSSGSYRAGSLMCGNAGYYYQNNLKIKNVSFQHMNNSVPYPMAGYPLALNFGRDMPYDIFTFQGNSFYNTFEYPNAAYFNGQQTAQNGKLFRHNTLYNIGQGFGYEFYWGNTYGYYPRIYTGNLLHNLYNVSAGTNKPIYFNFSHNIMAASDYVVGNSQVDTGVNVYKYGYPTKYIHERNLGIGVGNLYSTINQGQNDPLQRPTFTVYKNNKALFAISIGGQIRYSPDYPIENLLLVGRSGLDQRSTFPLVANYTYGPLSGFAPFQEWGLPTGWYKNYNKWGFDLWNVQKGFIVKKPNEDWYKYYFSNTGLAGGAEDFLGGLLSAGIHVTTNTTASFSFNFEYYNSIDHITQLDFPISKSINTNLFPPNRDDWYRTGNDAGAMYLMITKDGNNYPSGSGPWEIIPKSATPASYSKTISLEGEGYYYIVINQVTNRGFTALKNLDSTLITPDDTTVFLSHNAFTMKNFGTNKDKTIIGKATTILNTPNQKFRLKGGKLF